MKIFLIQDTQTTRDRVTFALESTFGAEIAECANIKQASKDMKAKGGGFDLVVFDLGKSSMHDIEIFRHETGDIPCVICFDGKMTQAPPESWKALALVDKSSLISNLLEAIRKLIEEGKLSPSAIDGEFVKIRTKLLLSVCPLKADIFIRLSTSKYLKLYQEGDRFELSDMQKYTVQRGIEHLYLRRADAQDFIDKYNKDLEKISLQAKSMSMEEMAKISQSLFETVQELGNSVGFTRDVQVMARHHMKMTVQAMGRSPRLSDILNKIKLFEGQYIAAHSSLTAYVACAIASHIEWASEATFAKLTMAAFLHDIALTNIDLAECDTVEEVMAKGFDEQDVNEFKDHPAKSAAVAQHFHEVPPDVDTIIAQHHEKPDGSGFPRKLTSTHIAPLACVFMVAHDLAKAALLQGPKFDLSAFSTAAKTRYTQGQFRKIMAALEKIEL